MRPFTRASALLVAVLIGLAGCNKGDKKDGKKDDKKDGEGGGTPAQLLPASQVQPGQPAQVAAQQWANELRNSDTHDTNKVSSRFLKQIGKPRKAGEPFDAFYAKGWLKDAASPLRSSPAPVGMLQTGFGQPGAAVFVGTYTNMKGELGRYLIRMVEEGGAWKLDWVQASAVPSAALDKPANLDEPFMDFSVQAAADLVAIPPAAAGAQPDILPGEHRAALGGDLFTRKLRGTAEFDVNQEKEDEQGYDYKRGKLGGKLDLFLGGKVTTYTRTKTAADTYKVVFTLEGGEKKAYEVKLVSGNSPGYWQVDEFRALPSA